MGFPHFKMYSEHEKKFFGPTPFISELVHVRRTAPDGAGPGKKAWAPDRRESLLFAPLNLQLEAIHALGQGL